MHEEGGAPFNIGAQHAQAFINRVPGFDDNVVQFVAQEVFNDALIARLDFEEISQHTDRSASALKCAGLKQAAHGLGGITVLGDDRFERYAVAAAIARCVLASSSCWAACRSTAADSST